MKGTTKIGIRLVLISLIAGVFYLIQFVLAPSITWTSNSDWSGGTFTNITNITGDLQLNNTIANGTQTIYSWFYNNWTYRKQITVNGSTSLQNDYQIMINLTNRTAASDNFDFARANSQGNDTRFTWLNTSSGLEQNISFWIENWTSSGSLGNATVWIKVPNVTASSVANTTIYMYYGNPSATYNNSLGGNSTFDFFDDFSGTTLDSKWSESGTVTKTISGGTLTIESTGTELTTSGIYTNTLYSLPVAIRTKMIMKPAKDISYNGNFLGFADTTDIGTAVGIFSHQTFGYYKVYTGGTYPASDLAIDTNNHIFDLYWTNGKGEMYIDNGHYISSTTTVPSSSLRLQLSHQKWTGQKIVDWILTRKYASPEPSALSIGAEQTAVSRGTYLSNTTTTSNAIGSITPTWNATNSTNVNFTVEISANNGANWLTATNNTAYTSGGGIGSGTQLKYRINFSTDNTSRTAVLSDITLNYVSANTTLACDAGGPYLANSTVMITGNVSDGASALASQPVTVQIKNSTSVFNSTTATSDASGNWVAKLFINGTNKTSDPLVVFANSTYLSVSGNCTYSLSVQAQTVTAANATCTTNSTACSFQTYPVSGWIMDSTTGGLINSGTIKLSVKETGDTFSTAFGGGYFSISPQFCLSPGVVYSFALSIEGNGKQGFMTYRRAGRT